MNTEPPTAVFYADVTVGEDGRAYVEVPQKWQAEFPAGTTVRAEAVL